MSVPAGGGFILAAEGKKGACFEKGLGSVEGGRKISGAEGFQRSGGFAGVKLYLGEGRRSRAVARIFFQDGFAQRAGARRLTMPEEHPGGGEEELAVGGVHG